MYSSFLIFLLSLLHLSSCSKEKLIEKLTTLNSELSELYTCSPFHPLLKDLKFKSAIDSMIIQPSAKNISHEALKPQLQNIYDDASWDDKLDNLSEFFSKLLEFLQLLMFSQIAYSYNPDFKLGDHLRLVSRNPKFDNIEHNNNLAIHILKVINLIKLQRSLKSPEFSKRFTFESIFSEELTDDGFGYALETIDDILSQKRFPSAEEKNAFKTFLLSYKTYFFNLEKWILEGLNPEPTDLNGCLIRTRPYTIDGIIHGYRLDE